MIIKNKKVLEHKHIHICLPVDAYLLWLLFVCQWLDPAPLTAFFVVVVISASGWFVVLFVVDPT